MSDQIVSDKFGLTIGLSDAILQNAGSLIPVTDSNTLTDGIEISLAAIVTLSDTLSVSDATTALQNLNLSLSDTFSISDSIGILQTLNILLSDTFSFNDTLSLLLTYLLTLSDTTSLSDVIGYTTGTVGPLNITYLFNDSITLFDAQLYLNSQNLYMGDNLILLDRLNSHISNKQNIPIYMQMFKVN